MKYEANFLGLYRYILVIYHFFSLTVKFFKKSLLFQAGILSMNMKRIGFFNE